MAHAQPIFDNVNYQEGARSHRFDLLHVAIDVKFDMAHRRVIGTVQHRMRSLAPDLRSVSIDAGEGMVFKRIVVDGAAAKHEHRGDTLDIVLPTERRYNDTFTVAIDYEVTPRKGLYFIQPDSLAPLRRSQIWTQGEAEDHRYWVPIYDYPNDRTTTEVRATIPSAWKLLSNGRLLSTTPGAEQGTTIWHYRHDRPHSTYLIMLAAGDYLVTRDTAAGVPLEYWSYPDMPERVQPTFGRTPDIMNYMADMFGPYPWQDKYAQVMIAEYMYGGMENTTATTLNDYALVDDRGLIDYNPDGLIAHEIAHQWFGDLVTNRSWAHLWIHESYATYFAARYEGRRYGQDAFAKRIYDNGSIGIRSEVTRGRDPLATGNGVTANIYQRGSRVLHMLNQLVGEELFQRANRHFLERHAYGLVETNDLKLAFEDATGLNLGWFFDQWVYKAGHPQLTVEKSWDGDTLSLTVTQTQERDSLTGLFRMPVPLEFYLSGRVAMSTIWVSEQTQTFKFRFPEEPRYVIFDAGDALLKTLNFPRPTRELIAQLDAPRMIDRFHAVRSLLAPDAGATPKTGDRAIVSEAMQSAFDREPSEYVRKAILDNVTVLDTGAAVAIIRRGLGDPVADVRQEAAEKSFMITSEATRASLLRPLLADSSYNVIAAALGMLAVTDTTGLASTLNSMKGMRGRRDRIAASWLNAVLAGQYKSMADDVADYTMPPYTTDTRVQAFHVLNRLETITPRIRRAVELGLREQSSRIRGAAVTAARSHLDKDMRALLQSIRESSSQDVQESIDEVLGGN